MLDLRSTNRHYFSWAKTLWTRANALKSLAFIGGTAAIFFPRYGLVSPYVVFALAVSAELVQWRSDEAKGRSEVLLRKLDYCKSFGGKISEADKRDITRYAPKAVRARFHRELSEDSYFESREYPGARKAVENLAESAWYSRELARRMVAVSIVTIVLVPLLAIVVLVIALNETPPVATARDLGRIVAALLLLIFSLGLFRNAWGYYKFKERADKSYEMARHLLSGDVADKDALVQWHEYQIGRVSSPLIPDWLWKYKEQEINSAWTQAKD